MTMNLITIKDSGEVAEDLKTYAESYIFQGEKFPTRLDIWFQDKVIATILFPPTTPETFETIAVRALWACGTFGGTHIVFCHPAEIAITSSLSSSQLEQESTPCMCVYQSSFLFLDSAVLPYTYSSGDAVVDWGQNSPEHSPIKDSDMLKLLIYNASQVDTQLADPQIYLQWLKSNGYQITFNEPYTEANFAYTGS